MYEIKNSIKRYELTTLSQKQTTQASLKGTQCKNVKRCSQQYFKHGSNISLLTYTCCKGLKWHKIEREQARDEGVKGQLQRGRKYSQNYGEQESLQLPQHFRKCFKSIKLQRYFASEHTMRSITALSSQKHLV